MELSLIDASNYFKGLLLLVRKDRVITDSEILLMKAIGKRLDYEPRFCENAINDLMENDYIVDEIPVFSSADVAKEFVKAGLDLACSDYDLHPSEEQWLRTAALKNGLKLSWYENQLATALIQREMTMLVGVGSSSGRD